MYITLPLFKNFDKTKFEVYAYSIFKHPNNIERAIVKTNSSFFFDVHTMDTLSIVELIRSHKIDILIDLAGYTKNCKPEIFAHKPAPIQINYCGFPGTMGTNKYDYIISDKSSIPQKNEKSAIYKILSKRKTSCLPHLWKC